MSLVTNNQPNSALQTGTLQAQLSSQFFPQQIAHLCKPYAASFSRRTLWETMSNVLLKSRQKHAQSLLIRSSTEVLVTYIYHSSNRTTAVTRPCNRNNRKEKKKLLSCPTNPPTQRSESFYNSQDSCSISSKRRLREEKNLLQVTVEFQMDSKNSWSNSQKKE